MQHKDYLEKEAIEARIDEVAKLRNADLEMRNSLMSKINEIDRNLKDEGDIEVSAGLRKQRKAFVKHVEDYNLKLRGHKEILRKCDEEMKAIASRKPHANRATELEISDHCVLRYIERHYSVPVDEIRDAIKLKLKKIQGRGEFRAAGFIVRDGVAVTYFDDDDKSEEMIKLK